MSLDYFKSKLHGVAADSILLAFVKVITALLGLITTKILSKQFSLQQYGTYSQAMLLVSTVTSLTILGLTDATNYFYNAADDEETKQKNIATVFGIQYFVGVFSGLLTCLFSIQIVKYFENPELIRIIYYAAWIPVFQNLIPMLQVLFISIGKAKLIALRNLIVSIARLIFVSIACYITKDVRTIIVLTLGLDALQTIYFFIVFSKYSFRIKLKNFKIQLIRQILKFSVPMAVFVFTSALSRDIDKYVISFFTDTNTLAIYTNAAKLLPFDLLTASFLTVIVPIITRQVRSENYLDAQRTLKAYLRIGYQVTWILVAGAIINAKEMMLLFYDAKYLPGLNVFIVYLFVDMIRFANTSLVLTAKGKTRALMKWSIIALVANLLLNVIAYKIVGIIGPAITTLFITAGLMLVFLSESANEINTTLSQLFDRKEILVVISQIIVIGGLAFWGKSVLYSLISSYIVILAIVYCFFVGVIVLINKNRLMDCLREINSLK